MKELEKARQHLLSGNHTCVLCKDDTIYTTTQRGVKPLVTWFESGTDFNGYSAADKVIGKATAFLYILLGVEAVYTPVISRPALQILSEHNIVTEYDIVVEHIINRKGDGICPFEATVLEVDDAKTAYQAIRSRMKEMHLLIH